MSNEYILTNKDTLTNIADSIRNKTGGGISLPLDSFAENISNISTIQTGEFKIKPNCNMEITLFVKTDDGISKEQLTITDNFYDIYTIQNVIYPNIVIFGIPSSSGGLDGSVGGTIICRGINTASSQYYYSYAYYYTHQPTNYIEILTKK